VNIERRIVLRTMAQFAMVAVPLGCRGVTASRGVEIQPLLAQARRLIEAMRSLGEPFSDAEVAILTAVENSGDGPAVLAAVDRVFATRCLAEVRINPESRVSIARGPADARLVEWAGGRSWSRCGTKPGDGQADDREPAGAAGLSSRNRQRNGTLSVRPADITDRWLACARDVRRQADGAAAVGAGSRYPDRRALQPRSWQARVSQLGATTGSGSGRHRLPEPHGGRVSDRSVERRDDPRARRAWQPGGRLAARRDRLGRVYPARTKRLAPDFFFQNTSIAATVRTLRLPAGSTFTCGRGPEYVSEQRRVQVPASGAASPVEFRLSRWIDPVARLKCR
jgi:hypothetical protein